MEQELETYHITWFERESDFRSKGDNFKAVNAIVAIATYQHQYPNTIFLSCVSMEVLNRKGIGK